MLIKFCMSGSAACVPVMAAKEICETENINPTDNKTKDIGQQKNNSESILRKKSEAFEVDFGEPMPPNYNTNLQEAFKKFRKQRQVGIDNFYSVEFLTVCSLLFAFYGDHANLWIYINSLLRSVVAGYADMHIHEIGNKN